MRIIVIVLASFALLLSATNVEARCQSRGLLFDRVTQGDLGADAALLLGLRPGGMQGDVERTPASLRLLAAPRSSALTVETLAPGLVVARASAPVAAGRYTLEGIAVDVTVQVGTAQAVALAAPRVSAIATTYGRRGTATTRAQLTAPVPAGVVAVVVSRAGTPIAWRPVEASEIGTTAVLVASTRRCMERPTGYEIPPAGQSVTLRFVGATGATSAESNAVTVVAGEP